MRMAAAAAKSLQSCPTLCDPTDAAHQAPPSLGFSRQEHWSGLPFPSPIQESESEVTQSCPTLRNPMDCSLPQAPPSMGFSRQEYWSRVPLPSPNENRNTSKYLGHWVEVSEVHWVGLKYTKTRTSQSWYQMIFYWDSSYLSTPSLQKRKQLTYRINMIQDNSSQSQR